MTETRPQNYGNHVRFHPLWHFVAFPIVMLNVFVATRHWWHEQSQFNLWGVVFAVGVFLAVFAARGEALTVQNRIIRLEMRLRLRELLPASMHAQILSLTVGQLVGLRFAGDDELPALVDRCLKGELKSASDVKKAVKNWQADWLRA